MEYEQLLFFFGFSGGSYASTEETSNNGIKAFMNYNQCIFSSSLTNTVDSFQMRVTMRENSDNREA